MNNRQLSDRIGNIDDGLIQHMQQLPERRKRLSDRARHWVAAAVLVVLMSASFSVGALAFSKETVVEVEVPVIHTVTTSQREDGVGVYRGSGGGLASNRPLADSVLTGSVALPDLAFAEYPEDPDLPVFNYPYPISNGGPNYDITEEMQEAMVQRLVSFMELLYGEYDAEKYPIFYEDADYDARSAKIPQVKLNDSVLLVSNPGNMFVRLEGSGQEIINLLPDGNLRQNQLLAAVLDFMGIDDWQTECRVNYDPDGQARDHECFIYPKTDAGGQELLNRLFGNIHIRYDSDTVAIYFDKQDYQPVSADLPTITLSQALDKVERFLPDLGREQVKVRVGYSREIREDYLIPCWELYIPTEELAADGTPLYDYLLVPAVDTAALAPAQDDSERWMKRVENGKRMLIYRYLSDDAQEPRQWYEESFFSSERGPEQYVYMGENALVSLMGEDEQGPQQGLALLLPETMTVGEDKLYACCLLVNFSIDRDELSVNSIKAQLVTCTLDGTDTVTDIISNNLEFDKAVGEQELLAERAPEIRDYSFSEAEASHLVEELLGQVFPEYV